MSNVCRLIKRGVAIAGLSLSPLLWTQQARAQLPNTRTGFWIGFGLGAGSIGATCEECDAGRSASYTFGLRAGFALSPHLVLGGETFVWNPADEDFFAARMLTLAVYPKSAGALFVKGGIGDFAFDQISENVYEDIGASGVAGMLSIGYDVRLKRNFSLTPSLTLMTSGRVRRDDFLGTLESEKVRVNLLHLGLGLTWH